MNWLKKLLKFNESNSNEIENDFVLNNNELFDKANELIKLSTKSFRNKDFDLAISLIDEALSLYYMEQWVIKKMNYEFKSGHRELAEIHLKEYYNSLNKTFFSQFTYDWDFYERKRLWYKIKELNTLNEFKQKCGLALNGGFSGSIEKYDKFSTELNYLNSQYKYWSDKYDRYDSNEDELTYIEKNLKNDSTHKKYVDILSSEISLIRNSINNPNLQQSAS